MSCPLDHFTVRKTGFHKSPTFANLAGMDRSVNVCGSTSPLSISSHVQGAETGASVILIGFPLGLEALLARASEKELAQIPDLPNLTLDRIASELSRRGLVRPFVTQGHISSLTDEVLLYDAATTLGGSGGPLLNRDGKAIAVNFAVMPEFSGASMGLHIRHVLALLQGKAGR